MTLIIKNTDALILEHVSEIMADTCNVNTRQKKNIILINLSCHKKSKLKYEYAT